jgi:hypothetical protein
MVASTCLTYLSFDVFSRGCSGKDEEFESLLQENPLLDYVARNWGHHARRHQKSVEKLVPDFLSDDAKVACASRIMLVPLQCKLYPRYYFRRNFKGMHLVAYLGLEYIIHRWLENGEIADLMDSYGRTPLSYSAELGHKEVVKVLLGQKDVDADSKDGCGRTPLSYAAENGHEEIVKLLLEHDNVHGDSKDGWGQTPLSYAAQNGREDVVKVLLVRHDVNSGSKDSCGRTPWLYAAQNGHEEVARLLRPCDDIVQDFISKCGAYTH